MKHISILDPLRGIAALMVVLFHYTGSVLPTVRPNPYQDAFAYGKLGVQVFFVISGFVIPYAMARSGYTWAGFWRFMVRRFVRIAPPAYIAAVAMIAFYFIGSYLKGAPLDGDPFPGLGPRALFANLTFTAEYLRTGWYNFVYWSLAVEFEYYIVLALCFPLIAKGSPTWRVFLVLAAMALLPLVPGPLFFHYADHFVLGIVVFLWLHSDVSKSALLLIVALCVGMEVGHHHIPAIAVALVAALVIGSQTTARSAPTDLLGKISYSLYITHVPVAYYAESVVKRITDLHHSSGGRTFLIAGYLVLALITAYVFHRLVELPAHELSKRIGRRQTAPA